MKKLYILEDHPSQALAGVLKCAITLLLSLLPFKKPNLECPLFGQMRDTKYNIQIHHAAKPIQDQTDVLCSCFFFSQMGHSEFIPFWHKRGADSVT